jgi:hypothetical protein
MLRFNSEPGIAKVRPVSAITGLCCDEAAMPAQN